MMMMMMMRTNERTHVPPGVVLKPSSKQQPKTFAKNVILRRRTKRGGRRRFCVVVVGENEEDDDEAQNEEAESPPRCLPGFAVGAIASTILLCGGGDGSIINPEPANASFVYYPTTNTATNPFELRMEKKTYMREETPKKLSEMNRMDRTTNTKNERKSTPLPLRLSANKEEDFELDERYDIGVPSSSFNANTTSNLLPSLRK